MPFLTLSNVDIGFLDKKLTWKTYSVAEFLFTIKKIQIIDWKEFVKAVLDPDKEVLVMHIATITLGMTIHLKCKAQIAWLKAEMAPVFVLAEYLDFANVFSKELATMLPKHTKINTHAIDLEKNKQPPYGLIYSLGSVELEILNTYIETNLVNGFIYPFKSPAVAPILFDWKPDGSFWLCVDYGGLNNLIIKNRYSLPLIGEFLDQLRRVKKFTQLTPIIGWKSKKVMNKG